MIGYIAKSIALIGKGEKHKAYRACDIAFDPFQPSCVRFLLLIKVRSPLGCISVVHSYRLGCHRVHGQRARRCDIPFRRPHCYDIRQLHMLCCSGTYTTHERETNATIDMFSRRICIFFSETCAWRVATTREPYNCLSVRKHRCNPTRVKRSLWYHW